MEAGGFEALCRIVATIEKGVETNQTRLISRALRHNAPVRTAANPLVLVKAVETFFPAEEPWRATLLQQLTAIPEPPEPMAVEEEAQGKAEGKEAVPEEPRTAILPEVEVYLSVLVVTALQRSKLVNESVAAADLLFERVKMYNRRTLDPLLSKVYFYYSLTHEDQGTLADVRPALLATHRTACLYHDEMGQATVLNLLLRNLLQHNLVEQAYKLVSKTNFPERASNNQYCRYLYYTGRIAALQLEYGDAYAKLLQSLRKAPQNTGAGFRRTVQKLMVIVQLLMGEVPERATFNQKDFRVALAPYLALTQAVRAGNLLEFNSVLKAHTPVFKADKTFTLVIRLSHNVIKTGLRRINVSYSRISMIDICSKLHLDSPESAEFVCAKAIRDGVIDAVLDHENGWMQSNEVSNVYATDEPQRAFHKRISFCLDVHNEAVRAMCYPADAYKKPKKPEEPEKSEEELAKEIEEELAEEE